MYLGDYENLHEFILFYISNLPLASVIEVYKVI